MESLGLQWPVDFPHLLELELYAMKRSILLILLLAFATGLWAQGKQNPRLYYRQFNNEYLKIRQRDLRYRECKIREEDRKKVETIRNAVVKQIEESRIKIANLPPFKDNPMMIEGYLEGLDTLHYAFTEMLDTALARERYQYQSYDELNEYYWKLDEAESKIKQGYAILRDVEDEFAIVQHMGLKRRTEIQEQFELMDKVNRHTRQLTLSYYRIDHMLLNFVDTINKYTNTDLDIFMLPESVDEIRILAEEERGRIEEFKDPELKKDLYKELVSYLKEIDSEAKHHLLDLAQHLDAEPFYTNAYRDARIDLDYFSGRYDRLSRNFKDARKEYILEYFPN